MRLTWSGYTQAFDNGLFSHWLEFWNLLDFYPSQYTADDFIEMYKMGGQL